MNKTVKECFGVLGLSTDATQEEIKKAYRKQALACHPDKNPHDPEAIRKFQELGYAYKTITTVEEEEDDEDLYWEGCFSDFEYWLQFFLYFMDEDDFFDPRGYSHCSCGMCGKEQDSGSDYYRKHQVKDEKFTEEEMERFVKFDSLKEQREYNKKIFCESKNTIKEKKDNKVNPCKPKAKTSKQLKAEEWKRQKEISKIAEEIEAKKKIEEKKLENTKESLKKKKTDNIESPVFEEATSTEHNHGKTTIARTAKEKNKKKTRKKGRAKNEKKEPTTTTKTVHRMRQQQPTVTVPSKDVKQSCIKKPSVVANNKLKHIPVKAPSYARTVPQPVTKARPTVPVTAPPPNVWQPPVTAPPPNVCQPTVPVKAPSPNVWQSTVPFTAPAPNMWQSPVTVPPPNVWQPTVPVKAPPPNVWLKRMETQHEIQQILPSSEEEELKQLEMALEMSKNQAEIEEQQQQIAALQEEIRFMSLEQEKLKHSEMYTNQADCTFNMYSSDFNIDDKFELEKQVCGDDSVAANSLGGATTDNLKESCVGDGSSNVELQEDHQTSFHKDHKCDSSCYIQNDTTTDRLTEDDDKNSNDCKQEWPSITEPRYSKLEQPQSNTCLKLWDQNRVCPYGQNCCLGKKCKKFHPSSKRVSPRVNNDSCNMAIKGSDTTCNEPNYVISDSSNSVLDAGVVLLDEQTIAQTTGIHAVQSGFSENWEDEIEDLDIDTGKHPSSTCYDDNYSSSKTEYQIHGTTNASEMSTNKQKLDSPNDNWVEDSFSDGSKGGNTSSESIEDVDKAPLSCLTYDLTAKPEQTQYIRAENWDEEISPIDGKCSSAKNEEQNECLMTADMCNNVQQSDESNKIRASSLEPINPSLVINMSSPDGGLHCQAGADIYDGACIDDGLRIDSRGVCGNRCLESPSEAVAAGLLNDAVQTNFSNGIPSCMPHKYAGTYEGINLHQCQASYPVVPNGLLPGTIPVHPMIGLDMLSGLMPVSTMDYHLKQTNLHQNFPQGQQQSVHVNSGVISGSLGRAPSPFIIGHTATNTVSARQPVAPLLFAGATVERGQSTFNGHVVTSIPDHQPVPVSAVTPPLGHIPHAVQLSFNCHTVTNTSSAAVPQPTSLSPVTPLYKPEPTPAAVQSASVAPGLVQSTLMGHRPISAAAAAPTPKIELHGEGAAPSVKNSYVSELNHPSIAAAPFNYQPNMFPGGAQVVGPTTNLPSVAAVNPLLMSFPVLPGLVPQQTFLQNGLIKAPFMPLKMCPDNPQGFAAGINPVSLMALEAYYVNMLQMQTSQLVTMVTTTDEQNNVTQGMENDDINGSNLRKPVSVPKVLSYIR